MTEHKQLQVFNQWLGQYRGLFFKVVRSYAFNAEDQDDLFQEILLQVWRSVPNFREESAVTTWLYRISLNTALKWKGKENRHTEGRQTLEYGHHVLQEGEKYTDERLTWLYEELTKLNEVDRSLCLLLLDDFSYKEMSAIVGITESNVAVKIHRIKQHLIRQSKNYQEHEI